MATIFHNLEKDASFILSTFSKPLGQVGKVVEENPLMFRNTLSDFPKKGSSSIFQYSKPEMNLLISSDFDVLFFIFAKKWVQYIFIYLLVT